MNRPIALLVLAWAPVLVLGQTIRCSDKVISHGTPSSEVARLCGNPAQIEHKTIYNDGSAGAPNVTPGTTVEVQMEMWIYNFGPDRLMQRIWFQDGVVVRIESLGRGS